MLNHTEAAGSAGFRAAYIPRSPQLANFVRTTDACARGNKRSRFGGDKLVSFQAAPPLRFIRVIIYVWTMDVGEGEPGRL